MKYISIFLAMMTVAFVAQANPQHEKMKTCNTQATGKKGDERKAFMKSCLSAEAPQAAAAAPVTPSTPQERMKSCNKEATGKKGDERKAFMSSCLKAEKI